MKKVTIYTSKTCPYCAQVKELLEKEHIGFEEKLVDKHEEEWKNVSYLTGLPTLPTINFENNYFIPGRDFGNPENLVNVLREYKPMPFSDTLLTLERLKSLNFNVNMAFGKLDHLLRQIEQKLNTEEKTEGNVDKSTD